MSNEYERVDELHINGLKIIQNPNWFCYGIDAVLLSDFAKNAPSKCTLDLCSGNGIIPLLLSAKTATERFIAVEIQTEIAEMANRSIALNGLSERIQMIPMNLMDAISKFGKSYFDVITCNPPYTRMGSGLVNPKDTKAVARHELSCSLEQIIGICKELLRPNGRLFMVHRSNRLIDVIHHMRANKIEPKRIQFVHPHVGQTSNLVLVEGILYGGCELKVEAPMIVYNENGELTEQMRIIYGDMHTSTIG